ncbi:GNAT family N-acetyltransferase [uncultured Lactobacillus sp.]|uniref:GNAT family N-acetyltransferase n=1 Tax=uncultured Lactobacillus sp. TaxID=153152 RepID=UPI00258E6A20|nr:GNAT family N-acetyltransferase [uncultured Lactobacillus sp.]
MKIKVYEKQYFDQLGMVMDKARMQELKSENLEQVFVAFRDAPYLDYLMSCKIFLAFEDEKLVGFIGFKPGKIEFIYVDPDKQGRGIATMLMEKALNELKRPIKLEVFTNNKQAKSLYKKFGFKTIKTVTEKWSDEYPVLFSEDTMELE